MQEHGNGKTAPRRELAAMLAQRTGSFTAKEIIAGQPDLSRATIYRTLRLLVQVGILCKTAMPDGPPRYSLHDLRHHHLICVSCGRIDEFRDPAVERMLHAIKDCIGSELIGHRLEFYYRCNACRKEGRGVNVHMRGPSHLHVF